MPTTPPTAHTRVWCDHGAAHPWVASHTDEHGQIIDVIGRADTRQAAKALTTTAHSPHALLAGRTTSGKTATLHALLTQVTQSSWPVLVLDATRPHLDPRKILPPPHLPDDQHPEDS